MDFRGRVSLAGVLAPVPDRGPPNLRNLWSRPEGRRKGRCSGWAAVGVPEDASVALQERAAETALFAMRAALARDGFFCPRAAALSKSFFVHGPGHQLLGFGG